MLLNPGLESYYKLVTGFEFKGRGNANGDGIVLIIYMLTNKPV
jgi:hypothetical protein